MKAFKLIVVIVMMVSFLFINSALAGSVLLDDFNRANSTTIGNGWLTNLTSSRLASIKNYEMMIYASASAGYEWVYRDVSPNYPTVLQNNAGEIDWAINLSQTRTDPSGFDLNNYGLMFVLGATTNSYTTASGYGIALGNSGTSDPIRLVKFTNGFNANSKLTNIISFSDFGSEYLSVRVTYNPSTNVWKMYVSTTTTSFVDPSQVNTLVGSASDVTYTNANLKYLGVLWNHATNRKDYCEIDNIFIPAVAPVTNPDIAVTPTTIHFGSQFIGSSYTQSYTINNIGDANLTISSITGLTAPFSLNAGATNPITPGNSRTDQIIFTPTAVGNYQSTMTINSNDPDQPAINIVVNGTVVLRPAEINVSPLSISDSVNEGTDGSGQFQIANQGEENLTIQLTSNVPWIVLSASNSTVSGGSSLNVTATLKGTIAGVGVHNGIITINNNDANENPTYVNVSFEVIHIPTPAEIEVSPASISSTVDEGSNGVGQIQINNLGEQNLTVQLSANAGWISLDVTNATITGNGSQTVNVTLNSALAGIGAHSATITIANNDANENPTTVSVNFTVNEVIIPGGSAVLLDDFNRANSSTVGNSWIENEVIGAEISNQELKLNSGPTIAREWVYRDLSTFYSTVFANSPSELSWAFNMRQSRDNPSGFDSNNYGALVVLGANNSGYTTSTGYAVALGNSGTADPLRLVKFSTGLDANADLVNVISYGDFGFEYLTIKVTFDPASGAWKLYLNSSVSSFSDPTQLNETNLVGSAVDNSYTGLDLKYFGVLWNHATGTTDNATFDNFYLNSSNGGGPTPEPQIAVNPAAISFGSVNTTSQSTQTITIQNTGNADLVISSLSLNNSVFTKNVNAPQTLVSGGNLAIDITFSPAEAITYNGTLTVANNSANNPNLVVSLTGTGTSSGGGQPGTIFPDLYGAELLSALIATYKTATVLGYDGARDVMYASIDNHNDTLTCVYTGYKAYVNHNTSTPRTDALNAGINCEHSWPQSMGAINNAKSDMHHLYPVVDNVNSSRGNDPFDEIEDSQTDRWWRLDYSIYTIPTDGYIDEYSEKDTGRFEPREDHKGDVARAMFYFYTMYKSEADGLNPNFFQIQKDVLRQWVTLDPVNQMELDRTNAIAAYQSGKVNPFVLDPTLVERAYFSAGGASFDDPTAYLSFSAVNKLEQNYPNPFNPVTTISYQIGKDTFVMVTVYDVTGREVKQLDKGLKPTGEYSIIWDGTNNSGSTVSSGTYFYQLKTSDYQETKPMIMIK